MGVREEVSRTVNVFEMKFLSETAGVTRIYMISIDDMRTDSCLVRKFED